MRRLRSWRVPLLLGLLGLAGCAGLTPPPRQIFDTSPIAATDLSTPLRLSPGAQDDEDPALVRTDDGTFYVVWAAKDAGGQVDLFSRSSREGRTWSEPMRITDHPDADYYPALAQTRDGTLHLAWFRLQRKAGRMDIWYAHSRDGRRWSRPIAITERAAVPAPASRHFDAVIQWNRRPGPLRFGVGDTIMRRSGIWIGSTLGLLGALLLASNASATALLDVVWQQTGTAVAGGPPGTPLTAEIYLTADAAGISAYGVSLRFDDDLVLAPTAPTELLPSGFAFNLTPGVQGTNEDTVLTFEAATFGAGPTSARFLIGLVNFLVSDAKPDGTDVIPGLFNTGIDGIFDNSGSPVSVEAIGAEVVPEPTTLVLLATGIAGLTFRRRARA